MSGRVKLRMLGQAGVLLEFGGLKILIDPYLSDSVKELHEPDLERQVDIPFQPSDCENVDWVLVTHEHTDHCDPQTIPELAKASPQAKFVGPYPVFQNLRRWGIADSRLFTPSENKFVSLELNLSLMTIAAAHPTIERSKDGTGRFFSYVLEIGGKRLLHTGDTSLIEEYFSALKSVGDIHAAFLPVNERNFFRERRGIIGNMSIREAYELAAELGVKEVIPIHWDMFEVNETLPTEIFAVYEKYRDKFLLKWRPTSISLSSRKISVVIRTLNEAEHLTDLLKKIRQQKFNGQVEIVLVDSGSTDGSVKIAREYGCVIVEIKKEDFSFGRALNLGFEASTGEVVVMVSGHCIPTNDLWLKEITDPIFSNEADYTFGHQQGGGATFYSEGRIFKKFYPDTTSGYAGDYFCNNANAALRYEVWDKLKFNPDLTGLEDMDLAKRLIQNDGVVRYVKDASVYHYHKESWNQVRRRFERESIALQHIIPTIHVNLIDFLRFFLSSVLHDCIAAFEERKLCKNFCDIVLYRWNQYLGTYRGNNEHRRLSRESKEKYFYPTS